MGIRLRPGSLYRFFIVPKSIKLYHRKRTSSTKIWWTGSRGQTHKSTSKSVTFSVVGVNNSRVAYATSQLSKNNEVDDAFSLENRSRFGNMLHEKKLRQQNNFALIAHSILSRILLSTVYTYNSIIKQILKWRVLLFCCFHYWYHRHFIITNNTKNVDLFSSVKLMLTFRVFSFRFPLLFFFCLFTWGLLPVSF